MNRAQKLIYWVDRHSTVFEKIETSRADWFEKTFALKDWFRNDSKIIDVGAGVCDITKRIAKYVNGDVVGIDIEDFRRVGNKHDHGYSFCLADANRLPFNEYSFDAATVFWTLHHIKNPENVLSEIHRVLKPLGQLIILEDLIDENNRIRKYFTKFYDNVINLEYVSHPHSNKSLHQWDIMLQSKFNFNPLELKEIPWFTKRKLLKFGLLRYVKFD